MQLLNVLGALVLGRRLPFFFPDGHVGPYGSWVVGVTPWQSLLHCKMFIRRKLDLQELWLRPYTKAIYVGYWYNLKLV